MNFAVMTAAALCVLLVAVQLLSCLLAAWRLRRRPARLDAGEASLPAITLLRPVCGLDPFDEETLGTSFRQDYPDYDIIFCAASSRDPVVPLVERLIAENPGRAARLVIGDDRISGNPKLNNLVKGWRATDAGFIVMADSNLILPPDYLRALLATFDDDTGLVSSPPVGIRPQGLWGALEAAFLNTMQTRWQFLGDLFGAGFAQGKTLFWRREVLERGGGLAALGMELAEDVASTKLVRRQNLKVRLAPQPFAQPIGRRSLKSVWMRQLRWARVRRMGFFWMFLPELLLGIAPALAALSIVVASGAAHWTMLPALVAVWYGAEWALARFAGWPASWRDIAAMALRDALLPVLWLWCWFGRGFVWRGNAMVWQEPEADALLPEAEENGQEYAFNLRS